MTIQDESLIEQVEQRFAHTLEHYFSEMLGEGATVDIVGELLGVDLNGITLKELIDRQGSTKKYPRLVELDEDQSLPVDCEEHPEEYEKRDIHLTPQQRMFGRIVIDAMLKANFKKVKVLPSRTLRGE